MKKVLIILGSLFALLLAVVILIPIIFKDDIRRAMDDAINENLNAHVYYDVDGFSISLIKSFPDLTVSMREFGVVGLEEFENDTLASIGNFLVTIDIMSVISGEQIVVEEILLEQPNFNILVLANGKANYDIAKASESESEPQEEAQTEETTQSPEGSEPLSIGIERWAITDANLSYTDESLKFFTYIRGLNHEGSGDFSLEVLDLTTKTTVDAFSLGYEGVEYISNKSIEADVVLNLDLVNSKYTFKENRIALNNFAIGADGYVSMPGEDIDMDITFGGKDIGLKSILSLIPGVYQEYLSGVSASGEINFGGYLKGTFNETTMPEVTANLSVANGEINYAEFNIPMEQINIQTSFKYPSANLAETSFNIDRFSMLVDGEPLSAYLKFKNLIDYQWDLGVDGNVDLDKITKIVPLEGMTLRGKINAKLNTSGKMSDVEAEKYDQLPTTGSVSVRDFLFQSEELKQDFSISQADLKLNPKEINLTTFTAASGNSDFNLDGSVTNFLAYALEENEVLNARLNFTSKLVDINQLMPEMAEEEVEEEEATTDTSAVKIPENIDFLLTSSIEKIAYDNISINSFEGNIRIKDGAILLEENSFKMLDGTFELAGSYRTKDLENPAYDLSFKIKDLSIGSAFSSFETIQQYVPIAKQVSGKFSTNFDVNGLLGSDMMPIMDAIDLSGLVNIADATLDKGSFVQKLSSVTSLKSGGGSSSEKISVKDVLIATSIKDGRMFVEPFDLTYGGQQATVSGSNGLDGSLDYSMFLKDVPTGALGNAVNNALSSFTGGKKLVADKINLNLGIGGTTDDPQVKLLSTSDGTSSGNSGGIKTAVKEQVSAQIDEQKEKAEAELDKQKEEQKAKIIAEAEAQAAELRKQGKTSAEKVRKEGYAAADKLIADAGSNPIKKKLAQEAAKKLRSETDNKAAAIEAEANKKADQIIAEAKARAEKI